jgi:hypothetical protein
MADVNLVSLRRSTELIFQQSLVDSKELSFQTVFRF